MISLQLGLSKEQRLVRGRERALDSTQKGMEALVRGRQEEIEARAREVGFPPTQSPERSASAMTRGTGLGA